MIKQLKYILIISITLFTSSCNGQINKEPEKQKAKELAIEKIRLYEYGAGDIVSSGYLDKSGNMWFTTLKEGVFKYDGKTFKNITAKDGLCSNKVNSVIEDKDGLLWFATSKGLCSYDGNVFSNFPLPQEDFQSVSPETGLPSKVSEEVLSIIQDRTGDFWLGTLAGGAYHFDGKTFTSYLKFNGRIHPTDSVYNNVIQSILEDNSGNIWFTSMTHGGISRYDGKTFAHFTKEDGLSDDMIFSSFKDVNGNLWFGTLDNGLISYKVGSFSHFKENEWQNISCFYQDKTGKLWVGSFREESVLWFDGQKFTPVPFDKNQKLVEIRFITEDKDGNIWFGGRYGILYRYDGKELKDFTQLKRVE
jgi:ligand-binding sensor domain-containing protein